MIIYHPTSTPSPAKRQTSMQMQMHSVDFHVCIFSTWDTNSSRTGFVGAEPTGCSDYCSSHIHVEKARLLVGQGSQTHHGGMVQNFRQWTETILDTEVGVVNTWRLWLWGDSSTWQRTHANWTPWRAPYSFENEVSQSNVVARDESQNWGDGQTLHRVSADETNATFISVASLVLDKPPMDLTTCRFYWSHGRRNVPYVGGFTF